MTDAAQDPIAELPLTTVESFIAALVEAGPEVAEHMTRAAHELLLAAQALVAAAERNLVEQRRLREEAEARAGDARTESVSNEPDGPSLRSVNEVA
jgi:hypothetical protein